MRHAHRPMSTAGALHRHGHMRHYGVITVSKGPLYRLVDIGCALQEKGVDLVSQQKLLGAFIANPPANGSVSPGT